MAHNLSWIDPETLRDLVAQTSYREIEAPQPAPPAPGPAVSAPTRSRMSAPMPSPAEPHVPARPEAMPATESVPFRRAPSVRRASRPSLPNPDASAVPAPPPRARAAAQPFSPSSGAGLDARLDELMVWACAATGLSRAFIADDEGLLVASLGTGSRAVDDAASTVELCTHAVPAEIGRGETGTVSMVVPERTHVVVWHRTDHGKIYLSLTGTVEPDAGVVSTLADALRDAVR